MEITFITDFVCPYCLVAKDALMRAAEMAGIPLELKIQPYELTPEPNPQVDTYHDERRKAGYQVLVKPAKALGLDMKLPPNVVPRPYTRLAFEGWHYACAHGAGAEYSDRVYRAYFLEEKDIGSADVLTEIAEAAGMDGTDFRKALEEGIYTEQQKQATDYARQVLKPKGVPTLWIGDREILPESYTVAEMLQILNDATFQTQGGFRCGPGGC